MRFGKETAIVIERYDRVRLEGSLLRLHQEDMCQALGLPPTKKYENEGGPQGQEIADLLRNHSSRPEEDVQSFLDAIAFNWLIAGTDAHAKNYSILIGAHGNVRLAPLYDVASILPYKNISIMKAKMAMKIGGIYRLRYVGAREWRKLAKDVRVDADRLLARIVQLGEVLPDHASEIKKRANSEGLSHPLIAKLADAIASRAIQCRRTLR
jgi:serine/threonine-protein kinase HipA